MEISALQNRNGGKPRLIVIAGPTATGKSSTAVRLAKETGGEIISADSMQVYRGMDIGSAKITPAEMQGVPHHLIDVMDPREEYSAAVFQQMASAAVTEISGRGALPIVCGGTGFYIQALLYGIDLQEEPPHDAKGAYRDELLSAAAGEEGREKLFSLLQERDPEAALSIGPNNVKRVIRALEFLELHGQKISEHNREEAEKRLHGRERSPYDYLFFVLTEDRDRLYQKIDARVDMMMAQGLEEETRRLYPLFYGETGPGHGGISAEAGRVYTAAQGIGYKEMFSMIAGETDPEEAVRLIKRNTRRFAKRQLTWFRREPDVRWIDTSAYRDQEEMAGEMEAEIRTELLPFPASFAEGNHTSRKGNTRP